MPVTYFNYFKWLHALGVMDSQKHVYTPALLLLQRRHEFPSGMQRFGPDPVPGNTYHEYRFDDGLLKIVIPDLSTIYSPNLMPSSVYIAHPKHGLCSYATDPITETVFVSEHSQSKTWELDGQYFWPVSKDRWEPGKWMCLKTGEGVFVRPDLMNTSLKQINDALDFLNRM